MKRAGFFLGTMTTVALAIAAVACNGLLGISAATVIETVEASVSCSYYCQTITQNCTDLNAEYQGDMSLCLSMCDDLALDNGNIAPSNDNTLGCRIYYAQQAATTNAALNCRFAGPLGGDRCGDKTTACDNFCALDVPYCHKVATPAYVDVGDCNDACMGAGDAGPGYVLVTDGGASGADLPEGTNTLNCRYYHLENAYPSTARGTTHCPHTMPISATCN